MKKYGKEEIKLRVPEIMVKILKEEGNEKFLNSIKNLG
jgi:hypothetical protein